jgi:serine/threonine protein kinase
MSAGFTPFYDDDPCRLFENIIACKPKFPANFDPNAKDLVKRLLTTDLTKRFGNLQKGVEDIKKHKWFATIDWDKLNAGQMTPPYIPPVKGEGDTSQFDKYEEDYEPYGTNAPDPYHNQFLDF